MFTGLVQAVGSVGAIIPTNAGIRLIVDPGRWPHNPRRGDSIAVNGCCLTHAPDPSLKASLLAFDVVKQTLDRTTLGSLRPNDRVNIESSVTPSSALGGHFVQGHIDGVATVTHVHTAGEHRLTVEVDRQVIRYIIPTGSVAIDGVSLTVATVDVPSSTFAVALIPTTLELTTLGSLGLGDRINIETDILSRTVVHYLENFRPRP